MWTSISKIIKKIILLYKTFLGEVCTRVLCLHHPHSSLTPQTVLMAPPFKIHDLLVIIFTCVYVCVYMCLYEHMAIQHTEYVYCCLYVHVFIVHHLGLGKLCRHSSLEETDPLSFRSHRPSCGISPVYVETLTVYVSMQVLFKQPHCWDFMMYFPHHYLGHTIQQQEPWASESYNILPPLPWISMSRHI